MLKYIQKLISNFLPKQNNYVGAMDKFLLNFNKKNPKLSASQYEEIEKYKKIYALRDGTPADHSMTIKKIKQEG